MVILMEIGDEITNVVHLLYNETIDGQKNIYRYNNL